MPEQAQGGVLPDTPRDEFWKGVFMAVALAVGVPMACGLVFGIIGGIAGAILKGAAATIMSALGGIGMMAFFAVGPSQLLWIIPLLRRYRREGRDSLARGLKTGAWIVFLLNASCWGLLGGLALFAR